MNYRKILGGIGKVLKWGVITLLVIMGFMLAINALDEDPSPELLALLASPKVKADPDNAFPALLGSAMAPANTDFVEYGNQWLDAYNAATGKAAIAAADARFPDNKIKFVGDAKLLCNPAKASCLAQAKEQAAVWRKLSADNVEMLARQLRLMEFSHFESNYFFHSGLPTPAYPSNAHLLMLNLIALDAVEGRMEHALAALEARIAFDRRALLGSTDTQMAMVSAAWLRRDYALLAEIVATRSDMVVAQKERLLRMSDLLDIDALRIVDIRMIEGESRVIAHDLGEMPFSVGGDEFSSMLLRPFYKVQATRNREAKYLATVQTRIKEFTPEHAADFGNQLEQDAQNLNDDLIHTWRVLYNPVGKFMVGQGISFQHQLFRLSDLMGIMRLTRLQIEIVTNGKSDAEIATQIAADKALYDPYTGKPMRWDAEKRQLYFDPVNAFSSDIPGRVRVGI